MSNESNESIDDIKPGTVIELNADDKMLFLSKIRQYDPNTSGINKVTLSPDPLYLIDVLLDDGALWRFHRHPVGLIPTLKVLGGSHLDKPLTPDLASVYHPDRNMSVRPDMTHVSVPEVNCGEGYRQLDFNETILKTDEWYAGPEDGWKKCNEAGRAYWPSYSSVGGTCALMRRVLPVVRKTAKP